MPDKSVPWTAEFWIKRRTMDDGEKNEDSLETISFSSKFRFHIRCSGLTMDDASLLIMGVFTKLRWRESSKKRKRRKKGKKKNLLTKANLPQRLNLGSMYVLKLLVLSLCHLNTEVNRGKWTHLALVARNGGGLKTILNYMWMGKNWQTLYNYTREHKITSDIYWE